jgi:two-component system OmpR family sensor kinase
MSGPRSLRARLVVVVVTLLAVATALIGAGTAVAMRGFLLDRLDDELRAVGRAVNRAPPPDAAPSDTSAGRTRFSLVGPPRPGSITVVVRDRTAVASTAVDRGGDLHSVPAPQLATLVGLPPKGTPFSTDLGPLGTHRMIVVRSATGDVVVTGLSEQPVDDAVARLVALELGIGLVVVLGAGVTGAVLVRRELHPLERVAATASRVGALPLDRGEVSLAERVPGDDPATEVGQVGAAFNRMLDHVGAALHARQESETQLRRFVADASHELRTPLAAIRGYAELLQRSPTDPEHAAGRITASAQRMGLLVEDLLLLARLDAGRELDRGPVDLTRLVLDAVSDAHVAGPDHRWRLDLPPEPVTVVGDATRLAQVLANLLANARTHTPPGTEVDVALRADGGSAWLTVVDSGPGIAPDMLPHVFERFARGEASRSREHGSTGLGLAIVDAVVAAHGGTVTAESRPGCTALTVTLPRGG